MGGILRLGGILQMSGQPASIRAHLYQNGKIKMSIPTHLPKFSGRAVRHITAATVLGGLFALYSPVANADILKYGIQSILGHQQAGIAVRDDYARTPHRNDAPAHASPHAMAAKTTFAPYIPFADGGSAVYTTPVKMKKPHMKRRYKKMRPGHGIAAKPPHASKVMPAPKHRIHYGKTYVRLKGVNRRTYSCKGYEGRPESFTCVVKSTEFIPRKGPWRAATGYRHGH